MLTEKPGQVEVLYQQFLAAMGLLPESKLAATQRVQLRHAFYGGVGSALLYFRDVVSEMDELEGAIVLEKMLVEIVNVYRHREGEARGDGE